MGKRKYQITEMAAFLAFDGVNEVRVFEVKWDDGAPFIESADVWLGEKRVRCTRCPSDFSAMRSDCAHAQAVKRYVEKREAGR